jgi:hypothetical protein
MKLKHNPDDIRRLLDVDGCSLWHLGHRGVMEKWQQWEYGAGKIDTVKLGCMIYEISQVYTIAQK